MNTKKNPLEMLEVEEQISKLVEKGYGDYVDKILSNETKCWTKNSRPNRSGFCRILGCTPKELDAFFKTCQEILDGKS